MDKQLTNIGIIRESRNDENRTPLVPEHIKNTKKAIQILISLFSHQIVDVFLMKNMNYVVLKLMKI